MKYYELNEEEQEILDWLESWEFKSVLTEEKKESYKQAARNTLNKMKNINIRISQSDLLNLKSKWIEYWLPYQTLIWMLIHQYSSWKIKVQM